MDGTKVADLDPLSAEYLQSRVTHHEVRGRVLTAHLPWLDDLVNRAMRRLPRRVDRDDVRVEAIDALLEAIERWDPLRGPLAPFARKRVLGHIGDWVRRRRITQRREFSLDELLAGPDGSG